MNNRELISNIFKEHSEILYFYLKKFRLSDEETYDLVQAVFLKLIESDVQKINNSKAWLFTVGRNMALNVIKKSKDTININDSIVTLNKSISALDHLIKDEKNAILIKAFQTLTEEEQEMYRLYLDGFSHKEIGSIINKSTIAVKVAMFRNRKKLKETIGKFEGGK